MFAGWSDRTSPPRPGLKNDSPGRIRTCYLYPRSATLYPSQQQDRWLVKCLLIALTSVFRYIKMRCGQTAAIFLRQAESIGASRSREWGIPSVTGSRGRTSKTAMRNLLITAIAIAASTAGLGMLLPLPRWTAYLAMAIATLAVIANVMTRSRAERQLWAPVAACMWGLQCAILLTTFPGEHS